METLQKKPTTKGSAEYFSGDVFVDLIADGELPAGFLVIAVHFTPGAHTAWHRHVNGQTLHVTEGVGLVGTRDGRVIEMHPGDTIYTPPGEWHWHGAAPDHFMTHLAMWEALRDGQPGPDAEWAEHITDEEYSRR